MGKMRRIMSIKSSKAVLIMSGAIAALALASLPLSGAQSQELEGASILVMSRTAGFQHQSIPAGQDALLEIAREEGFSITFTQDPAMFSSGNLSHYDAVVFLNTTGDILDAEQQAAFEGFIKEGHGLLGIHAAADTETDGGWPWYNHFIGAKFKSHPRVQSARLVSSEPGGGDLEATDEWYDFADPVDTRETLIAIDRDSYEGAASSGMEPIVWTNSLDGGRAYYIGLGHTDESYATPLLRGLIVEGLRHAAGR